MNYLAHAYLSFKNEEILVGNMISDFVKGGSKFNFPVNIQKGIMLHRMIDAFADVHPATKTAINILKPAAAAYAPVFADVVYDHFLAKDEKEFPENTLEDFAEKTYFILSSYKELLPQKFKVLLPYMIKDNWLLNYRFKYGIENSFNAVFRRAKYLDKNDNVFKSFVDNYSLLQKCYEQFMPVVKEFAIIRIKE